MSRVKVAEGGVVAGVEDDGEAVVLLNAHVELEVVSGGEGSGFEDLRGEDLRVSFGAAQEGFEVGGVGAGDKGGSAPVVEQGAVADGRGGGRELFEEEFAAAEAGGFGRQGDDGEKAGGGVAASGEAELELSDVGVKRGVGGGAGLEGESGRGGERKQEKQKEEALRSVAGQWHVSTIRSTG